MEGNDDVRDYSVMILRELGYGVIEAADADSALEMLRRAPRVDLLFTDVILPGRNGRRARRRRQKSIAESARALYDRLFTQRNRPSRQARCGRESHQQTLHVREARRTSSRCARQERLSAGALLVRSLEQLVSMPLSARHTCARRVSVSLRAEVEKIDLGPLTGRASPFG